MNAQQQLLILASALALASSAASAGPVTVTDTTGIDTIASTTYTFNFTPVVGASELVSASGGSFYAGEGGSLTVFVDYTNDTQALILQQPGAIFSTYNFTTILSNLSFTPGDVAGLTFEFDNFSVGDEPRLTIPQGTQFVFEATAVTSSVPEPAAWTLMVGGFGALGASLYARRRNKPRATT